MQRTITCSFTVEIPADERFVLNRIGEMIAQIQPLGIAGMYVSNFNTEGELDKTDPEETYLPSEVMTVDTMPKVQHALREALSLALGRNQTEIVMNECINNMQNAGILFRERI